MFEPPGKYASTADIIEWFFLAIFILGIVIAINHYGLNLIFFGKSKGVKYSILRGMGFAIILFPFQLIILYELQRNTYETAYLFYMQHWAFFFVGLPIIMMSSMYKKRPKHERIYRESSEGYIDSSGYSHDNNGYIESIYSNTVETIRSITNTGDFMASLSRANLSHTVKYHLIRERVETVLQSLKSIEKSCFDCGKQIDVRHAYNESEKSGVPISIFEKHWKSPIVQYYCCECFTKHEKLKKKEQNEKLARLICPDCNHPFEQYEDLYETTDDDGESITKPMLIFKCPICNIEYTLDNNLQLYKFL